MNADIGIVGAGLAGLTTAVLLEEAGVSTQIFEAQATPGGRVASEHCEGFILDKGFQVFLDSYPYAAELLDFNALELQPFSSGALVWNGRRLQRFINPLRHPGELLSFLSFDIATLKDLFALASLGIAKRNKFISGMQTETTAELFERTFSPQFQKLLLLPFFQGIFLEEQLTTDAAFFKFLLPLFGRGRATLPAKGMEQIPYQLVQKLRNDTLHSGVAVTAVTAQTLVLADGQELSFKRTVVATDVLTTNRLLNTEFPTPYPERGTTCLYFAIEGAPPLSEPILLLNGSSKGRINSLCFPSVVSPHYAPKGYSLCSVSLLSSAQIEIDEIRAELSQMLSVDCSGWRLLKQFHVEHALPLLPVPGQQLTCNDIYLTGDFQTHPSIEGALTSGRITAQAILSSLKNE